MIRLPPWVLLYCYDGGPYAPGGLGRQELLPRALSRHVPVVYVSGRGASGRALRPDLVQIDEQRYELRHGLRLRCSRAAVSKAGGLLSVVEGAAVRRTLRSAGVTQSVWWHSSPTPHLIRGRGTGIKLVYDCIDPCFDPELQLAFERRERDVVRQAAGVFCTAAALRDRVAGWHDRVELLENACAPEVFSPREVTDPQRPEELRGVRGPVVGQLGTIDDRFDFAAVEWSAKVHPQATFVMVGRVNPEQRERAATLARRENVLFCGARNGEASAAFLRCFDVALVPFRSVPSSDGLNAVKMWCGLCAGKPVVATGNAEVRRYAEWLYVAESPEAFAEAVGRALHEGGPKSPSERMDFAATNTWDARALRALDVFSKWGLRWPGAQQLRQGKVAASDARASDRPALMGAS